MSRKNRSPEEQARRAKIRVLVRVEKDVWIRKHTITSSVQNNLCLGLMPRRRLFCIIKIFIF